MTPVKTDGYFDYTVDVWYVVQNFGQCVISKTVYKIDFPIAVRSFFILVFCSTSCNTWRKNIGNNTLKGNYFKHLRLK